MDLAREDLERVRAKGETKLIGSNGKYFCTVATSNREKPKEEEEEVLQQAYLNNISCFHSY